MKRLREWLFKGFLLVVSFAFAIVIMELAVRALMPQSDRFVEFDPVLGWKHPANSDGYWRNETTHPVQIRINSHSLRGPVIDYQKQANQFRILMLGDSFTEAFQVEEAESHSSVLRQLLNSGGHEREFQVINSGVGGYGTGQELLYFQNAGKKYSPNLVVLNVCTNDLSDDADRFSGIRPIFRVTGDSLELQPPAPKSLWMLRLRDRFIMNLHLAGLIRERIGILAPALGEQLHHLGLGRTGGKSDNPQNMPRTVLLINALQREVTAAGAKLIVFMIPPGGLVHRTDSKEHPDKAYRLGELAERLRLEGIDVIEPLEQFRAQAAEGQVLYINNNGHWTAAGHALAAKVLYRHLMQSWPLQEREALSLNGVSPKQVPTVAEPRF
jgi:lysophospholipase L1-like esterase